MSVFTSVDVQQLGPWLKARGITGLQRCTGIQGGTVNTNYWLTTDQGPWVLTLVEDLSADAVRPVMALMHALAQNGLPVPDVCTDAAGNAVGELHGRPATLVRACPGDHPPAQPKWSAHVGRFLAQLHQQSLPRLVPLPNRFDGAWQRNRVAHWTTHLPAEDRALMAQADHIATELWSHTWPMAWTHGDLFPDNVLADGAQINAVIDWYFASVTPAVWDLAVTLNAWFGSAPLADAGPQALLTAYESVRPLQHEERTSLLAWRQSAAVRFWLSRLDAAAEAQSSDADRITVKPAHEYRQLLVELLDR